MKKRIISTLSKTLAKEVQNRIKKMNRGILILMLLCVTVAKSQRNHHEVVQEALSNAVTFVYENMENFDKEWFLIGTMSDYSGHYQTFTANKSVEDIDPSLKSMFGGGRKFEPDTMACQRITAYENVSHMEIALFVEALFKNDYPDLRLFRICFPDSLTRHYGSEVKDYAYYYKDSACKRKFSVDLFSRSLAKTVAGYYKFDRNNLSHCVISSGGDIGYRGIINRERLTTEAQKISFLAGVLLSHGGYWQDENHFIKIPNSLSALDLCGDLLKEFECSYIEKNPKAHQIIFTPSVKLSKLRIFIYELYMKVIWNVMAI